MCVLKNKKNGTSLAVVCRKDQSSLLPPPIEKKKPHHLNDGFESKVIHAASLSPSLTLSVASQEPGMRTAACAVRSLPAPP